VRKVSSLLPCANIALARTAIANFKVKQDATRPFRVHVDSVVVQAIGTQFDVYRLKDQTNVAVIEGVSQEATAWQQRQQRQPARQVRFGLGDGRGGTAQDRRGQRPAAVALGRKGGLKGGKARAESMTAKRRAESAKKAAKARWKT
jgi:ferric-dicitrate binding protein FerR (iron transport regulator)